MIAAIYARKSSDQKTADADAKSVARQIENARTFARAKGWTVLDDYVFSDEAVSGAETRKLRGRQRLLDMINSGRPPFGALILRDNSRFSRRDGDEAFGELKQLKIAGVEVWFYQDGTQFTFGDFSSNILGLVKAETAAEYRRQCGRLVDEALKRKHADGYVTGGRVFGYDNVKVNGHTERKINDAEAAVIRRIFALCANGTGYTRIAKQLNADGALAPKPTRGRRAAWCSRTVRLALDRPLYRGEVIYGRVKSSGPDGARVDAARPPHEWLRKHQSELRIVSPAVWTAAHRRLDAVRAKLGVDATRPTARRRRDIDSPYLLSGFVRCAVCGGSIGKVNQRAYGCIAYHKKGTTVCRNGLQKPMATLDDAVRQRLRELLTPTTVMAAIDRVLAALTPKAVARDLQRHRRELQTLDREIANLTKAVKQGDDLPPLLAELKTQHARREQLSATTMTAHGGDATPPDRMAIARRVRQRLDECSRLLARHTDGTRQLLRELFVGPLTLTPDGRAYRFDGELLLDALLPKTAASTFAPTTFARTKGWSVKFSGIAA